MSSKLHLAAQYALEKHQGQDRDGEIPIPYICHPMEVLAKLRYIGKVTDDDLLTAAMLHDTIEETDATFEEIHEKFGPMVAEYVRQVTREEPSAEDIEHLTKDEIYELRTAIFLEEIRHMSKEAQMIKLADRASNLAEAEVSKQPAKLERYKKQTKLILKIIDRSVNPPLWDLVDKMSRK